MDEHIDMDAHIKINFPFIEIKHQKNATLILSLLFINNREERLIKRNLDQEFTNLNNSITMLF